jgi:murein DD-endopeptidase MepM/ murein hydrolase activator NlpD
MARATRFAIGTLAAALAGVALAAPTPKKAADPAVSLTTAASASAPASLSYRGELTQGGFIRGQAPAGVQSAMLGDTPLHLAEDGSFFAAFDRDSPRSLALRIVHSDGRSDIADLTVSTRQWNIQHVNAAITGSVSSESFWERRKPELDLIAAARSRETGAAGWRQDFIWPVKGRISGLFGRQRIYRGEPGSFHTGIDIAPGAGTPFVAPADGVVVLARTGFSLEGGLIIIDHGAGLNSAFLHSSKIVVSEGDFVRQGQHIGNVGATGRATGPHLHWGLKWRDARLDPLLFTGPMN